MDHFFYNDRNALMCEDVRIADLASAHGTPLYVYSRAEILDRCRDIRSAFGGLPVHIAYALKANANEALLRILSDERIRADVVSGGEMMHALRAGFAPADITFAGVGKRDDEIEAALEKKIFSLVVESVQELETINSLAKQLKTKAPVFIRVNPDIDAGTHPYISTGLKSNKFGIAFNEAVKVLTYASSLPAIDLLGIHMHLGSQITSTGPYMQGVSTLVDLAGELRRGGIELKYLDIGGGFGVRYVDVLRHPLLPADEKNGGDYVFAPDIFKAVCQVLASSGMKIILEPGRFLVAESGILVAKVLYTKENEGKKFVIVDAAMTELIRPSLYHAHHQIVPAVLGEKNSEVVDVVGPVCESTDFLAKDRLMNKVQRGEYLVVLTAGAYGYVLASNYNARLRPAEVLVDGTTSRIIRRRETFEDLIDR